MTTVSRSHMSFHRSKSGLEPHISWYWECIISRSKMTAFST